MILADTSVWVDHLRGALPRLAQLVKDGEILMHPMIIGELACGNLADRKKRLRDWWRFPMILEAPHRDVLSTIESKKIMGRGIGFIDAHLLCAVLNSEDTLLWTRDNSFHKVAEDLGIAFSDGGWRGR